jgi:hypothetical protein
MNRREVIKSFSLVSAHALFPSVLAGFLSACKSGTRLEEEGHFTNPEEQKILKELIDIIIPKTKTSSASEAGVHIFLNSVFDKCFTPEQKDLMNKGFGELKATWADQTDKFKYVKSLDEKAFKGEDNYVWFKVLKQHSMIGFFTSQEGTTKAGDYQKIPDKFVGEITIDASTLGQSKTSLKYYI